MSGYTKPAPREERKHNDLADFRGRYGKERKSNRVSNGAST